MQKRKNGEVITKRATSAKRKREEETGVSARLLTRMHKTSSEETPGLRLMGAAGEGPVRPVQALPESLNPKHMNNLPTSMTINDLVRDWSL